MNRRKFIATVPLLGIASTAQADPVIALHQQWRSILDEWEKRIDSGEDWENPELLALQDQRDEIERSFTQQTPQTHTQIAFLAAIAWERNGPCLAKDNPEYEEMAVSPDMIVLKILNEWAHTVLS